MVGLDPGEFRARYPHQLSGGQQQRIGVARALAADPAIILMDEPFGALDPITRDQLQNEFLELESEIAKTILFVTHDVFEAVKMGDRIALLDQGRLQQVATPTELITQPANAFVDQFLGQHRFQLTLMTRSIRSVVEVHKGRKKTPQFGASPMQLRARQSLIEALDSFKQAGLSSLPVFDKRQYIGELKKETLLQNLTDIINETV
jgi:osmoprotectant transport system ATP-binding protein